MPTTQAQRILLVKIGLDGHDRGIKVVSNAGGLNPPGLAAEITALAERLGLHPRVAHVDGDDLTGRLDDLQAAGHDLAHLDTGRKLGESAVRPVTANAYLGGFGIAAALDAATVQVERD